ncbi:calcium-binding protein [Thalassococcus sp. BH17M4-6]|uniref:calcium-binding protein n=1 Tax=Thalassococcus sp. BH17M4-6 TaxID=3413148 RepID=UPI003BDF0218
MFRTGVLAVGLWLAAVGASIAQERDAVRAYMFANSLVHHLSDDPATNVPHWLDALADAAGKEFSVDGQWMFLKALPDELPPEPNWSFPGVDRLRIGRGQGFSDAGVDTILLNPENFIQYRAPDLPYEWDNPGNVTPLGATLAAFDAADAGPDARYFIYEGWADMESFVRSFPPSARQLRRYYRFNSGDYAEWYDDYVAALRDARPGDDIRLIPVSRILTELLTNSPLSELPVTEFFSDDAPHGTANTYFLAAMITYAAFFEAAPPETFTVPDTLHPMIADGYPILRRIVWQAVSGQTDEARNRAEEVRPPALQPIRAALDLPPRGARPSGLPALAIGLNGISDWSTQHPFVDLMKSSREWIGHAPGQWGGMDADALREGGYLDADGWPLRIPDGIDRIEALILTDQPEEAEYLQGRYIVRYDGKGELALTGRARQQFFGPGEASFSYTPGDGLVGVAIRATDPDDPIHNIRVVHEDHLPLLEAGVIFNPDWTRRIADLRALRFMDWMATNGSDQQVWDDRPRPGDVTYTRRGVPIEVMLKLANQIGADPWFTLPHMADDAYVRAFAEAVKTGLDPRLKAYVEYSNEVWNFIFPQAQWAQARAESRWGPSDSGWMQFYGLRAAQVMDIFTEVFDGSPDRLVRVTAMHTGWPGLEEQVLMAPLAWLELGRTPQDSFDAYAVSGYFGHGFATPDTAAQINGWLDTAEAEATRAGAAEGLRRVALREYVKPRRFDAAFAPAAEALRTGSLRDLLTDLWPHHAQAARAAGLQLIMYEGGTHAIGQGALIEDARMTDFLTAFSYSSEMAGLYQELLAGWIDTGGRLFNAFVDVATPTKWGSWGALRHLDDANPRWDVLMAHNATAPADWEDRDLAAFADGVMRQAGPGGETLTGTAQEDILLGGAGADVLISNGGADHLHGGPGQDRAILPGTPDDYQISSEGPLTLANGAQGTTYLAGIEVVAFDDAGAELRLDGGL